MKAAYSWSKSIDQGSNTFSDNESTNTSGTAYAFIPRLQKGVSDFDVTHNFVLHYSWTLPTPGSLNGFSRAVLGGWELGGIFTARSGPPFTVTIQTDRRELAIAGFGAVPAGKGRISIPWPAVRRMPSNPAVCRITSEPSVSPGPLSEHWAIWAAIRCVAPVCRSSISPFQELARLA